MKRRDFLTKSAATVITAGVLESCANTKATTKVDNVSNVYMQDFTQKPLAFAYNALEPYIDATTMELHYSKHAAAYAKNMNDALKEENIIETNLTNILSNISKYRTKMRNNAGGHFNHENFWHWITPGGNKMSQAIIDKLTTTFGSIDAFKKEFSDAGLKQFGSGWAWLIVNNNKQLQIVSTPNQDNPLMDTAAIKGLPVLGLDVWEHAYYLKYQNKRTDYINSWWSVVNWNRVGELLSKIG